MTFKFMHIRAVEKPKKCFMSLRCIVALVVSKDSEETATEIRLIEIAFSTTSLSFDAPCNGKVTQNRLTFYMT